jgi:glycosyltransferase EpsF
VLHVIGGLGIGGAETFVLNLYRNVDRDRVQFDFVIHSVDEGAYEAEITRLGGRVFRIPGPSTCGLVRYWQYFRQILRRYGPFSVVHSHIHKFSGFIAVIAASEGIPVRIAHSHTTKDSRNDTGLRRAYARVMKALLQTFATKLIGCSVEACQVLFGPKCLEDSRLAIVHNGIDWEQYAHEAEHRAKTRSDLGLDRDVTLICHVGNFVLPKNHIFLADVFRNIAEREPRSHLLLVGDGPLRAGIEALVTELRLRDRVTFLGHRRDVPVLLGAADLFIFPSLYEGVPVALIEAQMAGVACLASSRITREADLAIGLVVFLSLEAGTMQWGGEAVRLVNEKLCVSMGDRISALQQKGYDIRAVARALEQIYSA